MTPAQIHIIRQLHANQYAQGYTLSTLYAAADEYLSIYGLVDTRAVKCGNGIVLVTHNQLPQGFEWVAFKGKMTKAVKSEAVA